MRCHSREFMAKNSKQKILSIESNRKTATAIAKELSDRGFKPSTAHDGQEGLVAILKEKPDLVLCDVDLPIMSGFEVLERLIDIAPRFGHMPFVFMTGQAVRKDELKGRQLGADDYIRKPIDFDILAAIINARLAGVARTKVWPELVKLNNRGIEVLTLVARGQRSAQIAKKLGIAKRTVDFHLDNARIKLGAATRAQAVVKAVAGGVIEPQRRRAICSCLRFGSAWPVRPGRPVIARSFGEQRLQGRDDDEQDDRSDEHAADDYGGQRSLHLAANAGRERGRQEADTGGERGHQHRPHPLLGGMEHGIDRPHTACPDLVVIGRDQDSVHDRNAEERDKTDGGGDAEIEAGKIQRQHAAAGRKRNPDERHQAVRQRIEKTVEQHQDQRETDRNDDRESRFCQLQGFELSGPCDAISLRQLNVARDPLLHFRDRVAEIAVAHAELDRHIALAPLVVDVGRASIERNIGELVQRNVGVRAGRGLEANLDRAHDVDPVTVFRREPDRNVELAVRLQQRSRRRTAEGRLHEVVTSPMLSPYRAALSRSTLMFRLGCPRTGKRPRSVTPLTRAISRMTSPAMRSSMLRSRPMILTELAPLTPESCSSTLSWIYCEKLRPIPTNSFENSVCSFLMRSSLVRPAGHCSNGLSDANSSKLLNPAASLPSSGRPCCETTVMTSR